MVSNENEFKSSSRFGHVAKNGATIVDNNTSVLKEKGFYFQFGILHTDNRIVKYFLKISNFGLGSTGSAILELKGTRTYIRLFITYDLIFDFFK